MRRAPEGRRRLRPLLRSPRRIVALLVVPFAATTVLMVHLFPAAAENPRSGRLEIAEGALTAPGVYVGGDDLTGPASSNADLRGHGQKLERGLRALAAVYGHLEDLGLTAGRGQLQIALGAVDLPQ